jgi:hypothetical protein
MLKHILFLSSLIFTFTCFANESSAFTEQDVLYKKIFDTADSKGIDKGVFAAIILHESGNPKNGWKLNPYALNIGGYSVYPESKKDAYKLLVGALLEGEKQLGVGAGQIEWVYHGSKFKSLWDALDFDTNLDKASDYYLDMVKLCHGDTWCAAGKYHNRNPQIAAKYENEVKVKWLMLKEQFNYL